MSEILPSVAPLSAGSALVVLASATTSEAIRCVEHSALQTAFVVDDDHILVGIVTNGDIRRFLLSGGVISDPVTATMNRGFRAIHVDALREEALKLFDVGYSVVPRVDDAGRLVDCITPHHQNFVERSGQTVVRARAPARIGFAGGGTDVTYFFSRRKGLVLNAAIARYAVTTLIPRITSEVDIYSEDLGTHQRFESVRTMCDAGGHNLLSATAALIRPDFGFEMRVVAEFPVGSGLGGSSAVTTSIVAAFNELRLDRWTPYDMAEIAFQAERLCFKVPGGWQDQYAAAFGGFNLIEFMSSGITVSPLRLPKDVVFELEESLVLFDTGVTHNSGDLHKIQKSEVSGGGRDETLGRLIEYCVRMNRALARGELRKFGEGLHEGWMLKKETSSKVSSNEIDRLYDAAREAGALGGKLLGAGSGGHLVFYVPVGARAQVVAALTSLGCKHFNVRFDLNGAHSWRAKVP
jgi:D-glycero-alpha-D-manno-heptose-7-phosphate kinase